MPNYDWKCTSVECGHTFEQVTPSDRHVTVCPKCKWPAERQPSAPGFTVRGGTPKFHTK